MSDWAAFYDAVPVEPTETMLLALGRFEAPGFAVDLGCGSGRDALELLRRGWRVLAFDAEPEAIRRLRDAAGEDERLDARVARFEDAAVPPAQLVNSSFALPFCAPDAFGHVWSRIVDSLPDGARFSGQLFGDRDEWSVRDDMAFHTRAEAEALFRSFELEHFDEVERDGKTVRGTPKHWHVFHVVARRVR